MPNPISPDHYKTGEVECVDALRSALGPEGFQYFCQGNVLEISSGATSAIKAESRT